MRLRNWIAVGISLLLLLAAGTVGVLMNRSALQAANTVHLEDSQALAVNNGALAGQLQLLSAKELNDFATAHTLSLAAGNAADRRELASFAAKTSFFTYGVAITSLTGTPLNSSRSAASLPPSDDPGYAPLRTLLLAGKPGFSSVMIVGGIVLQAVAVPIMVEGSPAAILIGYINVASGQLQTYVVKLSDPTRLTTIVDSVGRIAASSDPSLLGTVIEPAILAELEPEPTSKFREYRSGETDMTALFAGGLPGGWTYVRSQTASSFNGPLRGRSQTINIALVAMLLIGVVGITALGYRSQVQRRRSDERFQALFQHAPDLVSVLDKYGRIAFSSPSASSVLGFPMGALIGRSVFKLLHPEDQPMMKASFGTLLEQRESVLRLQSRVLNAAGEYRWFEFTASNQLHNPALNGIVINARDISENRDFQERLAHEAEHDALTGLPNRRRLHDALGTSLRTDAVAVLFVDLDGFKPVNDAYGHDAGDNLLRQVSARLAAYLRQGDVLARAGGDEFVMLLPGVTSPADADATASRVREAIGAPFLVGRNEVIIGASVGVHLAAPRDTPDDALRAADHAMYAVKRAGGGRRDRDAEPSTGRHSLEALAARGGRL